MVPSGPERSASASAGESEGALVLVTEASFAAIRGLTTVRIIVIVILVVIYSTE